MLRCTVFRLITMLHRYRLPPACACNVCPGHTVQWPLWPSCTQRASPSPTVLTELLDTRSSSANEPDGCVRHPHSQLECCLFCHNQKARCRFPPSREEKGGGGPAPFPTYDKTGWNVTLTIHLQRRTDKYIGVV